MDFHRGDRIIVSSPAANERYIYTKQGWVGYIIKPNLQARDEVIVSSDKEAINGFSIKKHYLSLYSDSSYEQKKARRRDKKERERKEALARYIENKGMKYDVHINPKKRTLKLSIFDEKLNKNVLICSTKCHENDEWNITLGMKLLLERFSKACAEIHRKPSVKVGDSIKVERSLVVEPSTLNKYVYCIINSPNVENRDGVLKIEDILIRNGKKYVITTEALCRLTRFNIEVGVKFIFPIDKVEKV